MKRFFAALFILLSLFCLAGCNRISIDYDGNATLKSFEPRKDNDVVQVRTLTEEETRKVKAYLSSAEYTPGGGGCPFDENISITFGDQAFAIAYDDCPSVWDLSSDKPYGISEEGRIYIISLFEKYVGYFPYH